MDLKNLPNRLELKATFSDTSLMYSIADIDGIVRQKMCQDIARYLGKALVIHTRQVVSMMSSDNLQVQTDTIFEAVVYVFNEQELADLMERVAKEVLYGKD